MKTVLEVKNLTKIYKIYHNNFDRLKEIFINKSYHKKFIANDNISFELYEGETLGIIGVNGSGKSTILKQIASVISPTSGEIIRQGRVTALLELGTGFNQDMSGYENIFLNGTLLGMTHQECQEKVDEIIAFSELGDYIDEPIRSYSSGMVMRLAFSVAIYSEPQILIVDEALSVGDAHFAQKCTQALKKRKEEKMSIIYVSHDINSLKILCDRLILLNKGKVVEIDTPSKIINSYNFLIAKLNNQSNTITIDENNDEAFGNFDIEIKNVSIKKNGIAHKNFETGDHVAIEIEFFSKIDLDNLTVGIHIRDKFAQDIFGTNTSYREKVLKIDKENRYICIYHLQLNIGEGKYTLGTALHTGEWHTQNCFHWLDNAIEFTINGKKEDFFIGLCRLEPKIELKNISEIKNISEKRLTFQIEGTFENSYSLSIVNKGIARALKKHTNSKIKLDPTAQHQEYMQNVQDLDSDIIEMWHQTVDKVDVSIRNIYPPDTNNMQGDIKIFGPYGWEESKFPSKFVDSFNKELDMIFATSDYVKEVLESSGVTIPVVTTGEVVEEILHIKSKKPNYDLPKGFKLLHISSAFPRKGINLLLEAFSQLQIPVQLIIKTFENPHNNIKEQLKELNFIQIETPEENVHIYSKGDKKLLLINKIISLREIKYLYENSNLLVAPSFGEGFGLPMAEAMLCNLPVLTTGYGGQSDFCTPKSSWLIDFNFQEAKTHLKLKNSLWAVPKLPSLIEKITIIYNLPQKEVFKKTKYAREYILDNYSSLKISKNVILFIKKNINT